MELAVHADHRGQSAGADAGHDFQAELAVAGRLAGVDLQFPLDRLQDGGRALDVAGRAAADLDVVHALGLKAELVVERRHAIDLAGRQAEMLADPHDGIARQIAVCLLHVLENGDERIARGVGITLEDQINVGRYHGTPCY